MDNPSKLELAHRTAAAARYAAQHPDESGYFGRALSAPTPVVDEPHEATSADIEAIPTSEWAEARSALGIRSRGLFNQDVPTVQDLRNLEGIQQEPVAAPVAPADGRMTDGTRDPLRSNPSAYRVVNQD
jgi:hypothetical protein